MKKKHIIKAYSDGYYYGSKFRHIFSIGEYKKVIPKYDNPTLLRSYTMGFDDGKNGDQPLSNDYLLQLISTKSIGLNKKLSTRFYEAQNTYAELHYEIYKAIVKDNPNASGLFHISFMATIGNNTLEINFSDTGSPEYRPSAIVDDTLLNLGFSNIKWTFH
jgi:hypothetical protein